VGWPDDWVYESAFGKDWKDRLAERKELSPLDSLEDDDLDVDLLASRVERASTLIQGTTTAQHSIDLQAPSWDYSAREIGSFNQARSSTMARPPSKRRGITLGTRADSPDALDLLNIQPASSLSPASDQTGSAADDTGDDPAAATEALHKQLAELQRRNADLDKRWRDQAEQMRQLEEQRNQVALQTSRLQAMDQKRQRSGRLGVLLSLLALSAIAALGYHTWPRLEYMAGDLNRMTTGVAQISPQLQAVRGEVTSLSSNVGQMGSDMASLRQDVSGMSSDLVSLRKALDTSPVNKGAVQARAAGTPGTVRTLPRYSTTMSNRYRGMRPRIPW
jgi:prefoldin subunit 5